MIYIELINQPEIYVEIKNSIRDTKQNEKMELQMQIDTNSQLELEEEVEEEDIDFFADNLDNIKKELSEFLLDMVSTIRTKHQINAREPFMLSYDEIIKKMDYYRDREKQKIKDYFKNMTSDERKAEIILKKLHLGVFAIDNKKLVTYGKETGFYGEVITENTNVEAEGNYMEDLGEKEDLDELFLEKEQDEDDNLDIQQNEDDYDDMNDNAYEDYFDSEYN